MKVNKILILVLSCYSIYFQAQFLNQSKLKPLKKDIISFLVKNNETLSSYTCDEISNMAYVRTIFNSPSNNISIYQISPTSSHSSSYIGVVVRKKISFLQCKDLYTDIPKIIEIIESIKISKSQSLYILKQIITIYQSNFNILQNKPRPDSTSSSISLIPIAK